ncbi:uncharacterized protein DI49_3648 [Saccharomyces eubayanus]|uniref:uncharacterized protein n=1 Tax=Saccharomyces eubayanus TaxID=1080349 RepID=UPI0006BFA941|nr:hypothetical protein DI49_3648 [Saccharomyces eubayanus]KOG97832.1 hypothetical protein DI49_3648 [Saccharomyces eubayanus]
MGGASELTNKDAKNYLRQEQASRKSANTGDKSERDDVADSVQEAYPLVSKVAASMDRSDTSEEQSTDEAEQSTDEAEQESKRAYAELVATLQAKGIPLSVLDHPSSIRWLEKYTGVYRSSWHG